MNRIAALIIISFACTGDIVAGDLPTVGEVLDRFVAAVGGTAALEAIDERRYRGTILQDLSWDEPQHRETPFIAVADAAGTVRYAETGDWSELPQIDAVDLQAKLRWVFHPRFALVVEDFFPGLRVDRREMRAGRKVVVLVPEGLKPEYYSLYFDEETGLLNHVGYHNDLGDWRAMDGIRHPHRWVFGRKGGHTTYTWREVISRPPTVD
ncbi:MAG: hypothetical protein PVF46_03170 [Lysobacterales bacterium]|jgi:hypothetical protein